LARALHEQKRDDEARNWVQKAIEVNPKSLKAWYQKGWMTMAQDPDAAITDFQQALSIQPNFAMAHRDLGMLLLQKGRYADAATQLEQAKELGLNHPKLFNFLGIAYSRTGRYRDAVKVYNQALGEEPDFAEAHLNLSYAYEKLNHPNQARAEFERACQLNAEFCQYDPNKVR
jgi:tetratricopeptide (TPR) repeat protein